MKNSTLVKVFLVILLSTCLPAPSQAKSYTISFPVTAYADPFDIQFEFKVEVEISPLSQLTAGEFEDMTVDLKQRWANAISEYEPFVPCETMFLTPLGDSGSIRITIPSFFWDVMKVYVKLSNANVRMDVAVEGNGTASPSSLWSSTGVRSIRVSHSGLTSAQEKLVLRMSFNYTASLTVTRMTPTGIIFGEETRDIEVRGNSTISTEVLVVPAALPIPLDILVVAVLVTAAILVSVVALGVIAYRKLKGRFGRAESRE